MRVAVLGARGNLGRHLCEELQRAGHMAFGLDRTHCDLGRPDREPLAALRERLRAHGAELLVNCAAFTDVDGAETQAELAYRVNALGAELAARAGEEAGAAVCQISTDFVFAGDRERPYDEFDAPDPRSVYARSKWAGEGLAQRACRRLYLVRVEGLYGCGGRNFASTLVDRLRRGQKLSLDRERRVSPTWSRALARQLVVLCESGHHGTYHATCEGATTWYEFAETACRIAAELGRPLTRSFEPVATAALAAAAEGPVAPRPAMSILDNRMLRLRGLHRMPPWQAALRDYLIEFFAEEKG